MAPADPLIMGEFSRAVDERFRVAIPQAFSDILLVDSTECILAKERPGCLSLWRADAWKDKLAEGIDLIRQKIKAGKMEGKINQVQSLGRLLSTRHREIKLDPKGRLLIPEGFREFLGITQGAEIMVVGAAVCVEIWNPEYWIKYLQEQITEFGNLFNELSS